MTEKQPLLILLIAWTLWPVSAIMAQRGEIHEAKSELFTNPTQGYPGFFDTNMAAKDSLVVEWPPIILPIIPVPSIAVDYGVSDTLTVGTNALVTTLPWLLGARGVSIKARSLIYGSETRQSAATVYAGYIGAKNLTASWQVLTSNNAWKFGYDHIVSAQATLMNLGVESGAATSLDYTNLRLSTLGIGGGYQYLWSDTLAISTYLLAPAWTSVEADTVSINLNANFDVSSGNAMWGVARTSFDYRSDEWVYSLGAMYVHGIYKGLLPWFSATRRC